MPSTRAISAETFSIAGRRSLLRACLSLSNRVPFYLYIDIVLQYFSPVLPDVSGDSEAQQLGRALGDPE